MIKFIRLLIGDEDLKTSQYDVSRGGWVEKIDIYYYYHYYMNYYRWVEKDPETTQSFKRRQQVRK